MSREVVDHLLAALSAANASQNYRHEASETLWGPEAKRLLAYALEEEDRCAEELRLAVAGAESAHRQEVMGEAFERWLAKNGPRMRAIEAAIDRRLAEWKR